jgi:hypothetical protein
MIDDESMTDLGIWMNVHSCVNAGTMLNCDGEAPILARVFTVGTAPKPMGNAVRHDCLERMMRHEQKFSLLLVGWIASHESGVVIGHQAAHRVYKIALMSIDRSCDDGSGAELCGDFFSDAQNMPFGKHR